LKRFWLFFGLATLVGGVFLWLAARSLPWSEVGAWADTRDASHMAMWGVIFVFAFSVSHAARVFRWYYLVRPLGEVSPGTVHRVCVVGLTAILLLPLRLGELVRPYLLARRTPFAMTAVLGTAVVERVVDGLVVTGLLFVTLATYDGAHSPEFARVTGMISAAIFLPALGMIILAMVSRRRAIALVHSTFGRVSSALGDKLAGLLESFIDGFRALAAGHAVLPFMGITAMYWGANIFSMWLLARFGFGFEVGLWETTTILAVIVIGIMIPAGPAGVGNFEFFTVRGLALFVVLEGTAGVAAGAFAATLHILQFLVIAIPGFVVMWSDPEARHLIRLSREADSAV